MAFYDHFFLVLRAQYGANNRKHNIMRIRVLKLYLYQKLWAIGCFYDVQILESVIFTVSVRN